jgi:hypothetical protein
LSLIVQDVNAGRLLCVLMAALATLASHCPDIVPRVRLCLAKVDVELEMHIRISNCFPEPFDGLLLFTCVHLLSASPLLLSYE